jgi:spermidine synthase
MIFRAVRPETVGSPPVFPPQTTLRTLVPLFFLSGAAALVYQVVWQRVLSLSAGVGIRSMAIVVGAFMLGLGLGSEIGGRWANRLSPARALKWFAIAEGLLCLMGAASPYVYYDLLYNRVSPWMTDLARIALVQFAALLPPTLLMGASLPLLVRALVISAGEAPRIVTRLFAVNVLGSAVGAVATPWLLLRVGSLTGAALVAAGCNGLVAILALALLRRNAPPKAFPPPPEPDSPSVSFPAPSSVPLGFWAFLFATSGFVALGLEMTWFRVIDVTLKGTAFTFGTVLGLYLLGLALGALLPYRPKNPMAAFAACQAFVVLWGVGAILAVAFAPETWPGVNSLIWRMASYRGRLGPAADTDTFAMFLVFPSLLFLPATIAMGVSFSALQRAVQVDALGAARRTGLLQSANIAGSLLGSLAVGLVAFETLGTSGTLIMLTLATAALCLAVAIRDRQVWTGGLAAALVVLALFLVPANDMLWRQLHARAREASIFEEDSAAVVGLIRNKVGGYRMSVNGAGHSELPYGGTHTLLGALAVGLHPRPAEVAVIGLGSGNTAWAALARPEVRRVVVYEIAPSQGPALRRLAARHEFPELSVLLEDSRLTLRFEDGRRGLNMTAERFDVIEIDALYPWAAWSGNIYSVEFFELCRQRLAPGGLFVTWAPTERIKRSVAKAFPFTRAFANDFLVGSNEPVPADLSPGAGEAFERRIGASTRADLERIARESRAVLRSEGEVNRDLHPRDEFAGPGGH